MPLIDDISTENLEDYLIPELVPLLKERDGAAHLLVELPKHYCPESVLHKPGYKKPDSLRIWEVIALWYKEKNRIHEALSILSVLYNHMVYAQELTKVRCHKGMPLLWMSDCARGLGYPVLAKRYLMLTLIEDAITEKGIISPNTTGTYFRLVWINGLPDLQLRQYAKAAFQQSKKLPMESMYPEWILQDLDHNWVAEFPTPTEMTVYKVHSRYMYYLISQLGEKTGSILYYGNFNQSQVCYTFHKHNIQKSRIA